MTLAYLLAAADPLTHVLPHKLGIRVGPFDLTNHMLMALVAAVLMVLLFPLLFRRAGAEAPSGTRNFFEAILEFLRVEVVRPVLKENTDRFIPFLWTLFFFILFCNLLGSLPLNELAMVITGKEMHFAGTATGNLMTTLALAAAAFVFIHLMGVVEVFRKLVAGTYGHHDHGEVPSAQAAPAAAQQDLGALTDPTAHYADEDNQRGHPVPRAHPDHASHHVHDHGGNGTSPAAAAVMAVPLYLWNFAPHVFKPGPGQTPLLWLLDVPMWLFFLVLEVIGALAKPFSLMIRLFANMIAGHIVLAVLIGLIPVGVGLLMQIGVGAPITVLSLLIRVLELFVSFLQAYIFVFLTTLFIGAAVAPEH